VSQKLPPKEYYESLARVPTSGAAIIRNEKGEFLIQKQTYKDDWHLSGGMSDLNETPREAAIREVKEELDITIDNPRLFCVDFDTRDPFVRILFVFDAGILSDDAINKIRSDPDEIAEYKFVSAEEMLKLLAPKLSKRMQSSFEAFEKGLCVYLENGERVD